MLLLLVIWVLSVVVGLAFARVSAEKEKPRPFSDGAFGVRLVAVVQSRITSVPLSGWTEDNEAS